MLYILCNRSAEWPHAKEENADCVVDDENSEQVNAHGELRK